MEGKEVKVQTVKPSTMESVRRATSYAAYRVGRVAYKSKVTREVYDAAADLAGVAGKIMFRDYGRGIVRDIISAKADPKRDGWQYGEFVVTDGSRTIGAFSYEGFRSAYSSIVESRRGKPGNYRDLAIVRACRYIRESDNRISSIISRYLLNRAWGPVAHYSLNAFSLDLAIKRAESAADDRFATKTDNLAAIAETPENIRDTFFYRAGLKYFGENIPFPGQPQSLDIKGGQASRYGEFRRSMEEEIHPYPIDFFYTIAFVLHNIRDFFFYSAVTKKAQTGGDKKPTKEANLGATLRQMPRGHGDGELQPGKTHDIDQGGLQAGKTNDYGRPFVPQPDEPTPQPGQKTDRYDAAGKPIKNGTPGFQYGAFVVTAQRGAPYVGVDDDVQGRIGSPGSSDSERYLTAMKLEPLHVAQKGWLARFIGLFVSPKPQEKAPEVSRTDDDKKI